MNNYITAATIKMLREKSKMTQEQLADIISVSAKTVSKWETGRGLPDITLLEPLASALKISVAELLTGNCVENTNKSGNMLKTRFYVCPVCGNIIYSTGETHISCCGITLPALEPENDEDNLMNIERVEDEYFISIDHEMTKTHYISFAAYVTSDKFQMIKFYPEGNAETRFFIRGTGYMYFYCNHHGLFRKLIR